MVSRRPHVRKNSKCFLGMWDIYLNTFTDMGEDQTRAIPPSVSSSSAIKSPFSKSQHIQTLLKWSLINDLWQNFKLSFFELENTTSPIFASWHFRQYSEKKDKTVIVLLRFLAWQIACRKIARDDPIILTFCLPALKKNIMMSSHELYEFFPRINISNGLRELKLPLKLKSSLELLEANLIKSCL